MTTPGPKVQTPVGNAPVIPLLLIGVGGYLAWFSVHYWGSDTRWPSDPVKSVLQGKGVPAPSVTLTAEQQALEDQLQNAAAAGGVTPGTGQANPNAYAQAIVSGAGAAGTYSHAQLMQLWKSVGGSAATAQNAACHAIQESSGRPKVTSSNPDGGINVGLWQLDTKGVGAGHTVAQLQDPVTNARITVMATRNGTNWAQWATSGC
jgi:hypothetical protein